jgi:hypothetical protein
MRRAEINRLKSTNNYRTATPRPSSAISWLPSGSSH